VNNWIAKTIFIVIPTTLVYCYAFLAAFFIFIWLSLKVIFTLAGSSKATTMIEDETIMGLDPSVALWLALASFIFIIRDRMIGFLVTNGTEFWFRTWWNREDEVDKP
jgi:hypothetical protein